MADYEDVKVTDLVINNISQEKYDELKAAGQLEATQIYLTPTEEGGGAGGDYLPLSGGTMAGSVDFAKPETGNDSYRIQFYKPGSNPGALMFRLGTDNSGYLSGFGIGVLKLNASGNYTYSARYIFTETELAPSDHNESLGRSTNKWLNVYAKKLNNGADIAIPTEGGTLARLEDLEGLGGGASLPDQTDNAGKFLMTDGATASWGEALANKKTEDTNLAILGDITSGTGSVVIGPSASASKGWNTVIGAEAKADGRNGTNVVIGNKASSTGIQSVVIGPSANNSNVLAERAIAIGWSAKVTQSFAIQLGTGTNNDANTFKVANTNGNFEMMDANGNVPLERLTYVTDQIGDISTALTAILGE